MTARSVDDIVTVLEAGAADMDAGGERAGFSLLEHGLQCADILRGLHPDDVELQVAGLVHDIGQTLTGNDDRAHGSAAAMFIRPILGDRVARLVELHVAAKRYLVTVDAAYFGQLSRGSRESLIRQGTAMSADEVTAFESLPDAADAVALRRADDSAKDPSADAAPLTSWLSALREVASRVHVPHDGDS
jgi:predicted HD phosphohydrolase